MARLVSAACARSDARSLRCFWFSSFRAATSTRSALMARACRVRCASASCVPHRCAPHTAPHAARPRPVGHTGVRRRRRHNAALPHALTVDRACSSRRSERVSVRTASVHTRDAVGTGNRGERARTGNTVGHAAGRVCMATSPEQHAQDTNPATTQRCTCAADMCSAAADTSSDNPHTTAHGARARVHAPSSSTITSESVEYALRSAST